MIVPSSDVINSQSKNAVKKSDVFWIVTIKSLNDIKDALKSYKYM